MSRNYHPVQCFRSVRPSALLFQSLDGMTFYLTAIRLFNPSVANSPLENVPRNNKEVIRLVELMGKRLNTLVLEYKNMATSKQTPHGGLETRFGKITEIKENRATQHQPKYAGKVVFRDGQTWDFVTEIGSLDKGGEYKLTYEFTQNAYGEAILKIRKQPER